MARAKAPAAASTAAAVKHASNAVQAATARYHAELKPLQAQIAALTAAHAATIEKATKAACAAHGAPYAVVNAAALAAAGTVHARQALTPVQVHAVRAALASGTSGNALARQYGVSPMCISRIRSGQKYAGV